MSYLPLVALVGCFISVGVGAWLLSKIPPQPDPEARRVRFAAASMTGIFLVFLFAMSLYASDPTGTAGKAIWDGSLNVLPPLGTLVLGFWFGSKQKE